MNRAKPIQGYAYMVASASVLVCFAPKKRIFVMKDFTNEIKTYLKGKTLHDMKSIVLKVADILPVDTQDALLAIVLAQGRPCGKDNESSFNPVAIITHIQNMVDGIEGYSIVAYYCDNYYNEGYDIQSDDGLCSDYTAGHEGVLKLIENELYAEAAEASRLLFGVRDACDDYFDYDGLAFDMFIDAGMIKVDLGELNALWGYCQLMSLPEDLAVVLKGIYDRRNDCTRNQPFRAVLEAQEDLIPNREQVIEAWIKMLYAQPPSEASAYISEAAELLHKVKIMEDYVATVGSKTAVAYIDLIEMRRATHGDISVEEIVTLAKKGLENTARGELKRSNLATILATILVDSGQDVIDALFLQCR